MLTQPITLVKGKADIYTEEFWVPLHTLIRGQLDGRIRMLHLVHAPGESANVSKLLPKLNDFGIEDLTVVGFHWPRIQKKHLRRMSDLRVLNVSGNGIAIMDNGKLHFDHYLSYVKILRIGYHCQFRKNFKKTSGIYEEWRLLGFGAVWVLLANY
jgi:hypothetical protein